MQRVVAAAIEQGGRELLEELAVAPSVEPLLIAEHPDDASVFLICFLKTMIEEEPECLELVPADEVFSEKVISGSSNLHPPV